MVLWILKMVIDKEKNTKCKYNATNAQLGQFFKSLSKVALPVKLYSILVHIHQSLIRQLVELDKYNNIDRWPCLYTLVLKKCKQSKQYNRKYDPDKMKYLFTFSEDKHGLCKPKCVLYCVLLAANSKAIEIHETFRKNSHFLFGPCLINTFYVLLDLCNYWSF